jgi:hypothetical protein
LRSCWIDRFTSFLSGSPILSPQYPLIPRKSNMFRCKLQLELDPTEANSANHLCDSVIPLITQNPNKKDASGVVRGAQQLAVELCQGIVYAAARGSTPRTRILPIRCFFFVPTLVYLTVCPAFFGVCTFNFDRRASKFNSHGPHPEYAAVSQHLVDSLGECTDYMFYIHRVRWVNAFYCIHASLHSPFVRVIRELAGDSYSKN